MRGTDKDSGGRSDRRKVIDIQERRTKAMEQIATALGQIHHELVQLRVQATNINVVFSAQALPGNISAIRAHCWSSRRAVATLASQHELRQLARQALDR